MDTPERNKIGTPASKFEDSPVFNYINSLSPIKPVKSLHITQTFNSLSFASLPSVFTSPHVTSHKESRFITTTRYNGSDPSKTELSSENPPEHQLEISAASPAIGDGETPGGAIELPRALNYDSGSPECTEPAPEPSEEERDSETTRYHEMCLGEPRRDVAEDWEDLISDSADILIFDSPIEGRSVEGFDLVTRLCEEQRKGKETEIHAEFACKSVLSLHRGIRRRCLDFETAGNRRRSSNEGGLIAGSSIFHEQGIGPIRPCDSSSRVKVLPGIGLHLNALAAAASKDCQIVSSETLPSGIQIRSLLCPVAPALDKPFDSNSAEDGSQAPGSLATEEFNPNSPKKKRRRLENGGEAEGCKRCNCKKSKCLKLYCECFAAGVYCSEPCACQECFNTPIHEDTVLATRKQIESRNPLAFAPKVIRTSYSAPEFGHDESSKTPASSRHKRGCNCKKSGCLKKYCECFQGGVGCSINCRCEGCKNAFGRKDGSAAVIDVQAEPEEEEAELSKKSTVNKTSHKIEIIHNEDRIPGGSALPLTPLQINSRPLIPLPFSSKGKPPRSSLLSAGSSSSLGSYDQHKFAKPSILRSQPMFEKRDPTLMENGQLPEILRGDTSPVAGIKTLSPNRKRISPPQCHFGSPTGRRSGRKLILQSIPSFPSLTPHQ